MILGIFLSMKKKIITNQYKSKYFGVTISLNMKVRVIEIKPDQLKGIFSKLDYT